MLIASTVINESGISFGTSGARGLVIDFTDNVTAAFTHSFLNVIRKSFGFSKVAIAIDNRPSSYAIAQACAYAIADQGFDVDYQGVIPTPALAYYSMQNNIPCIMITGSHIPFDRNGLKFYRPDGEISKADELEITSCSYEFEEVKSLPRLFLNSSGAESYISRYTSLFGKEVLAGTRLGIYEHSSAGRDIYAKLFRLLGAEVITFGRSNEFVPIDTEAVSREDRERAIKWSEEFNLDAIFSTDGDGDRPLISDENGEWLRGDILGLLAAEELKIQALAVPVSCNTAIELSGKFVNVKRTKIGSPFVIAELENLKAQYGSVAGFEANGGFLLGSDVFVDGNFLGALATRDAVLPALMLLIASRNGNVSDLIRNLPRRFTWSDRLKEFPVEVSWSIIRTAIQSPDQFIEKIGFNSVSCISINQIDGARFYLSNGDIFHLRPSGNAPELRCYTESADVEQAKKNVYEILNKIKCLP